MCGHICRLTNILGRPERQWIGTMEVCRGEFGGGDGRREEVMAKEDEKAIG